jgi:galactose oxidase
MVNLGNAWHIPANPEPRGVAGMRDPVFPTAPGPSVIIGTGNQFAGGAGQGNQLQIGSSLFFKQATAASWVEAPLIIAAQINNNKYYSGTIPAGGFHPGDVMQYYLRIAYDDHDTTFLQLNADGVTSTTTADENAARAKPFSFTVETTDKRGEWGPVLSLPNVGIHAHMLPNGLVLMWGRRDDPGQSLNVVPPLAIHINGPDAPPAQCTPFLWNPSNGAVRTTGNKPTLPNGSAANLFCSSHAFLPDGRLLVAGGHLADGQGLNQTTFYDPVADKWTPSAVMNEGRWYPTVVGLPVGGVLVLSGHFRGPDGNSVPNTIPQVWNAGVLSPLANNPQGALDLFPRAHVRSNGQVFTTGTLEETWSLDISGGGSWTDLGIHRHNTQRDYAPSVLYDVDKVIYIGGGSPPIADAELLDLSQLTPKWQDPKAPGTQMTFARRQHNATILPDGTVLVTGGTRSGGAGPPEDFNNLDPGQPVHIAELWDPASGHWTQLAAEKVDRCYHSTAVLLPDGRVLSAGGGEFFPKEAVTEENNPADTHRDAQIFSPPYLFKGTQPVITSAPDTVSYGETFHVETGQAGDIQMVTWIGLSSVTHSFNTGQRFIKLAAKASADGLDVTAPGSPNTWPPGHYMMFLVTREGVPSVAKILQLQATSAKALGAAHPEVLQVSAPDPGRPAPQDAFALRASVLDAATGTKVVVGITGTCPYGISACWGGANEALHHLDGIEFVDPIPDGGDSTATVFLADDGLPPLERWRQQFHGIVNDSYTLRGVEVTISGRAETRPGHLVLDRDRNRPAVVLVPLNPADKVQWNPPARVPKAAEPDEVTAYATLKAAAVSTPGQPVTVTGPLVQAGSEYQLEVRITQ